MKLADLTFILEASATSSRIARSIKNLQSKTIDSESMFKVLLNDLKNILRTENLSHKAKQALENDIRKISNFMTSKGIKLTTDLNPVL